MPKTLPKNVSIHIEKARESAIAAVDCYNRCGTKFRSGSYIVLMMIAWTSLFHAIFFKRSVKPFYRKQSNPKRFERVDGDYKAWELPECISNYYPGQASPVIDNLKLLYGLQNKIEHRSMPELDNYIFGECQSCLLNFEELMLQEFGSRYNLSDCLSLAIQFSKLRDDKQGNAISELHKPIRANIKDFIDTFRSTISHESWADQRFSYKVYLIPKTANHINQSDFAVEFIKFDPANPLEMEKYNKLTAILKPSVSLVANAGRYKAGDVCRLVLPTVRAIYGASKKFTASMHHVRAAYYYKVRPKAKDANPQKTNPDFCHYDEAHKDYVYTQKWVDFLNEEMKKPGKYDEVIRG